MFCIVFCMVCCMQRALYLSNVDKRAYLKMIITIKLQIYILVISDYYLISPLIKPPHWLFKSFYHIVINKGCLICLIWSHVYRMVSLSEVWKYLYGKQCLLDFFCIFLYGSIFYTLLSLHTRTLTHAQRYTSCSYEAVINVFDRQWGWPVNHLKCVNNIHR